MAFRPWTIAAVWSALPVVGSAHAKAGEPMTGKEMGPPGASAAAFVFCRRTDFTENRVWRSNCG
jgi:hypothetical protein